MPIEYRCGSPSIEEWEGLWKRDALEATVTNEEFYAAYDSLDEFLSTCGKNGFEDDCDFYVRGDPYGDKTQHIEIVNPNALTVEFLRHLQRWIRESYPAWRIVIPTFIAQNAVIVVYENIIRLTKAYETDLIGSLATVRQKMLSLDAFKHTSEKNR